MNIIIYDISTIGYIKIQNNIFYYKILLKNYIFTIKIQLI